MQRMNINYIPGYQAGLKSPSLRVDGLSLPQLPAKRLVEFVAAASPLIEVDSSGLQQQLSQQPPADSAQCFIQGLYQRLLRQANIAIAGEAQWLPSESGGVSLQLPTTERASTALQAYLRWAVALCQTLAEPSANVDHSAQQRQLQQISRHLAAAAPYSRSCYQFLGAAEALNIPSADLLPNTQFYGQGRRSFWMDSSFSQYTNVCSTNLARNKAYSNVILAQAGLPVPRQYSVNTLQQAKQAARSLGYPVVVKPAGRDGGVGVTPDVRKPQGLEMAFKVAKEQDPRVLVENHVNGRDYRITVFRGRALIALERVPGGVTGDGASNITVLIAAANSNPRRGVGVSFALRPLVVDDEMRLLLAKQQLSLTSVPAPGQFVRLRHTANINSGGMPVDVTDQMHPDNAALAVRAAKALRLDLAGVDLLIPDIADSWRQSEAAICEVNAQPTIGSWRSAGLYQPILSQLTSGNGRIPVVVVIGELNEQFLPWLQQQLQPHRLTLGFASAEQVWIGGEPQAVTACAVERALLRNGQLIFRDSEVDVALLQLALPSDLALGLPCDRIDLLLNGLAQSGSGWPEEWQQALATIEPYLAYAVGVEKGWPAEPDAAITAAIVARAERCAEPLSPAKM